MDIIMRGTVMYLYGNNNYSNLHTISVYGYNNERYFDVHIWK